MLLMGRRLAIPVIPADELLRLWRENRMPEKRATGLFAEIVAYTTPARDPALPGVRAVIIKLLTPKGQHIGTVHDIINADNTLRESHVHDYTLRDCSRVRIIQKQEQAKGLT
jgi:hypothetical protein